MVHNNTAILIICCKLFGCASVLFHLNFFSYLPMLTLPNFFLNIGDPKAMKNFQDTFEYSKSSHSVWVCPKKVLHCPKSTLCEALNRPQKLVKKNYTNPNHYYINLHYLNNFGPKRKLH